ncbi:MAG: hypothetical protein M3Q56_10545 [Bacteroidota bacterium]|nr:hypothetical protein [Bacteroidota bacterium]
MDQQFTSFFPWKKQGLNERMKDLLLACTLATIGIIGSYLILEKSIINYQVDESVSSKSYQKDATIHGLHLKDESGNTKTSIIRSLLIQGDMLTGSTLKFNNLSFESGSKYMIDFGNGIRQSMNAHSIYMKYNDPGIYIVQCFLWKESKWHLIGVQTLSVRSHNAKSYSSI